MPSQPFTTFFRTTFTFATQLPSTPSGSLHQVCNPHVSPTSISDRRILSDATDHSCIYGLLTPLLINNPIFLAHLQHMSPACESLSPTSYAFWPGISIPPFHVKPSDRTTNQPVTSRPFTTTRLLRTQTYLVITSLPHNFTIALAISHSSIRFISLFSIFGRNIILCTTNALLGLSESSISTPLHSNLCAFDGFDINHERNIRQQSR